uniref:Uncharacterized protein n=1 Tax=Arundo donax TaxID=35708 RepID=A0A0A9BF05_ARUDO
MAQRWLYKIKTTLRTYPIPRTLVTLDQQVLYQK